MKYKLLLFFLILSFKFLGAENNVAAQKTTIDIKIDSLTKRVNELEKTSNDKELIQEYKDLNNIYSIGFGILIGLFGIVFPLLLYLIQIKPSQDALKEVKQLIKKVDEDFEKSFEQHLRKSKERLISQAIENFEKETEHSLPTSYTILDSYKSEGFTETQVIKLLKLLKRENFSEDDKTFMASLLPFQEDDNIEEYFVQLIKLNPADEKCIWGAIYFANYKKNQYYDLIAKIVISGYNLTGMIASLSHSSKKFALELLNNNLLIDELPNTEIKTYGDYGAKFFAEKIGWDSIKETHLWKKYTQL